MAADATVRRVTNLSCAGHAGVIDLDARPLRRRWLAFHGAILGMALVNLAVFALARTALPAVAASATGIAAAAVGNFVLGDRVVFRPQRVGIGASDAAA